MPSQSQWLEHVPGTGSVDWLLVSCAGLKPEMGERGLELPGQTSESEGKVTSPTPPPSKENEAAGLKKGELVMDR